MRRFKESTTIKNPDPTIVDMMYEDQELVYETMRVLSDHPNVLDDLLLVEKMHEEGVYEQVLKNVSNGT
jgi:hypothetical protein